MNICTIDVDLLFLDKYRTTIEESKERKEKKKPAKIFNNAKACRKKKIRYRLTHLVI